MLIVAVCLCVCVCVCVRVVDAILFFLLMHEWVASEALTLRSFIGEDSKEECALV